MQKHGFWFCLKRTIELRLLFPFLRFRKGVATFKGKRISLEISDSLWKNRMGLSFRDGVCEQEGMLLVYEKVKRHRIWMMNVCFSIDILWLDHDGKVLHIVQNAPPAASVDKFAAYYPIVRSKYVLELAAGNVKEYGIAKGNTFNLLKT